MADGKKSPQAYSLQGTTAEEALAKFHVQIVAECKKVWREEGGEGVCEIEDLVQEAQLRIVRRWARIVPAAKYPRTYVALEARRGAQRALRKLRKEPPSMDIMQFKEWPDWRL